MLRRAVKRGDAKPCDSMRRKSKPFRPEQLGGCQFEGISKKTHMWPRSRRSQRLELKNMVQLQRWIPLNMENLTFLETKNISKSRNHSYQKAWSEFLNFVRVEKIKIGSLSQLDAASAWWIDQLYFAGEDVASVMTFMASVLQQRNDVKKMSSPDTGYEIHEGLQEDGSRPKSSSPSVPHAREDCGAHRPVKRVHGEHLAADDVAHCGATRRDVEASMEACGSSQQDQSLFGQ